jgi:putative nucleotidyltransferase with HDIG domain
MDTTVNRRADLLNRLRRAWHATKLWVVFGLGLIGSIVVLSLPAGEQATFLLSVGDVAQQDIAAPFSLTYPSETLTDQARDAAAAVVADVFDPPDSSIARDQLEKLRASLEFISAVRGDSFASTDQQLQDLQTLQDVSLDDSEAQGILSLSSSQWEAVRMEALTVLEQVMRSEIREGRVDEARRALLTIVSISMPDEQAELVITLVGAFVAPNALYNEAATEASKSEARDSVGSVNRTFAAGETIISGGQVVGELEIEAMQAFGMLTPPNRGQEIAIRGLLLTLLVSALGLYAYRLHREQIQSFRLSSSLSALLVITILGMQLAIPGRTVLPYLYPAATLPILVAVLVSPGMALGTSVMLGAVAGFLFPSGLELALYYILAGAFASLMIGKAERLTAFFWAGLAAALASVAVIAIFRLPDPATDIFGKVSLLGASVVSGLLSASLSFGLLLLLGNVLGITSNLQLIELSRPDHPLQQQLLRNAPGTYQHSLQLANLAEQAARAIGANPYLTRVGALYHDVGKSVRPQFFIENQLPGQNPHDQLDPATSADMILSHVREGLDLARKHRLPANVTSFISEHHGTMETRYQYHAALEAAGNDKDKVDLKDFTYSGPRPRSRETAILMLADGVEARARAEMPQDEEAIEHLVRDVIQNRLKARQLDRTDLTLKDLDTIRRSYTRSLKSIHHPRIRYPERKEAADQAEPDSPAAQTITDKK